MTINIHKTTFAGYPLTEWTDAPFNPEIRAYRVGVEYNDGETWSEKFGRLVNSRGVDQLEALVVGAWWGEDFRAHTEAVITAIVQHHMRLASLKALFIADVTYEESEISWILQTDLSPIFMAYPRLEHFGVRGSDGLRFGHLRHPSLRSFVLESGGTPADVIRQLAGADLPQLTDFELWTGDSGYGWNGTLADLMPFISGSAFPHLKRLALCNSEIADEIAQALIESPLYPQLEHLDLSRGTLSDTGAQALLSHPATKRLTSLDVQHHFCTPPFEEQLRALREAGVNVLIDRGEETRSWNNERYVAVGE